MEDIHFWKKYYGIPSGKNIMESLNKISSLKKIENMIVIHYHIYGKMLLGYEVTKINILKSFKHCKGILFS